MVLLSYTCYRKAVVEGGVSILSSLAMGAAGAENGALMGSAIPGAGTIIGVVIGFIIGCVGSDKCLLESAD